jgi:DNA repair protein SbcC/Rad50
MIIASVRLHNIKSFVDEELRFARGINIIAGRNGAGKSTVIEAVGLALFDAWPRKLREGNARIGFIRNGEREGSIEVDVQRGDARYTVRCNLAARKKKDAVVIDYERLIRDGHGHEIANSAGRKKEFQDDMRRLILGEGRIDDDKLFRDIIGTEQGGFDEPFTRNESDRRELFEKILGIEDFQVFEKQFAAFARWQGGRKKELEIRHDERSAAPRQYEEALTLRDERRSAFQAAESALKQAGLRSHDCRVAVEGLQSLRDTLNTSRAEYNRLKEKLNGERAATKQALALRDEARQAAHIMTEAGPGHESYLAAEQEINTLRELAKLRDTAREHLAAASTEYEKRKAELSANAQAGRRAMAETAQAIETGSEELKNGREQVESLRLDSVRFNDEYAVLQQQASLASELRSWVQDVRTAKMAIVDAAGTMRELRSSFDAIGTRIADSGFDVDFLPELQQEAKLLSWISSASREQGEDISTLEELFKKAQRLEKQLLRKSREAQDQCSTVKEKVLSEQRQCEQKEKTLSRLRNQSAEHEEAVTALETGLAQLNERWLSESSDLDRTLKQYADIDSRIAALETAMKSRQSDHDRFLANAGAAELLDKREQTLHEADQAHQKTQTQLQQSEQGLRELEARFSEEEYNSARQLYDAAVTAERDASVEHGQLSALLREQEEQLKRLKKEFDEFGKLCTQLERTKAECAFADEVLAHVVRELARRVGASIVSALSAFAAELYCRLAPEQGLQLHWDETDYAVELRGDGAAVRGRELSGGQLMGVSLAIKLALIKWYSQCRVGFLDEPTTHLDRETRLHLADVIRNLEHLAGDGDAWFDQLFIISHEQSFSGAGHRIELERLPERGSVRLTDE